MLMQKPTIRDDIDGRDFDFHWKALQLAYSS